MATGLQFKENLTVISGGYRGEGVGSNGVTQNWTETQGDSGSSTVTYWYHDSAQMTDRNSTIVRVKVTDTWTAVKEADNTYKVTVHSVLDSITRERVGSPSSFSVSIFVRRERGGSNIWTSGGCVSATTNATHATNVDLGTYTITLPPGQSAATHGAIYYRSNVCGYDNTNPPSIYVDEYWLGINFRNTLPPDYRPGQTWSNTGSSVQTVTGTSINVSNTLQSPFEELKLNGVTEQAADPTPTDPKPIKSVTGEQTVVVSNGHGQSHTYQINLGKNLFNKEAADIINAYISGATPSTIVEDANNTSVYIPCEPNTTYTVSKIADNVFRVGTTSELPADTVEVSGMLDNYSGTTLTITTAADAKYLVVFIANIATTATVQDIIDSIQIERGSRATTYADYITPYELQNMADEYIYQSGNDWFVHKETSEVELSDLTWDGASNALKATADITDIQYVPNNTTLGVGKANNYIMHIGSGMSGSDCVNHIAIDVDKVRVNTGDPDVLPSGRFVYKLATPTDRQVLEPALIAQLNAIKNGGSYTGNTTINVTGDLASPLKVGVRVATGSGTWQSHNRNGGWAGVYNGSTFKEMRTVNGPDGTGDPPTIKHPSAWKNQRKIGLNS